MLFAKPHTYRVGPDAACHDGVLHVLKGNAWSVRHYPAPGHAGLRATATAPRVVRIDWRIASPKRCATAGIEFTAGEYDNERWMPTSVFVKPRGRTHGSVRLKVASYLAPPDVVLASAYNAQNVEDIEHGITSVLIRR